MRIGIFAYGSLIYDPRYEIKIVVETIDRNIENR
jgi:cation transport regulator ChaC